MSAAFYTRRGDVFVPSELTRGPWDPGAQHAGPPSALLGRAVERDGFVVGRITVEILRPCRSPRSGSPPRRCGPGATSSWWPRRWRGGRGRGRARDRLAAARGLRPHTLAGPADAPPPGPDAGGEQSFFPTGQTVGYHTAMDYRFLSGGFLDPGPAEVWLRMRQPLIEDEPDSPLTRLLVAADSGNGVSAALDYRRWLFINTELTVHLVREPAGEWICLDAITRAGPEGVGLAESVLWDERGRLGVAAQTLLVRQR